MDFIIEKDKKRIEDIIFNLRNDLFNKNISKGKLIELSDKFSKNAVFLVGINNSEIVGYSAFYCNDKSNQKGFISIIVVSNKYQKQGYGKMFINEISKISHNCGMRAVRLQVDKDNKNAIIFYEKNGFNICFKDNKMYTMELIL